MNLNKFIKKFLKFDILTSYIVLFLVLTFSTLYFLNNNYFKLIEGNGLKDKGKDEGGAKKESEAQYTITNEVLPPSDHVTESS